MDAEAAALCVAGDSEQCGNSRDLEAHGGAGNR